MSDLFDQERATVREWTDLLARVRFGTVKVAGRNITGARIKAVASRLADYADSDGSRVRPGIARIAVDTENDYATVKRAVQYLARLGLLRLVRRGAGPGQVDLYQLAIPEGLMEQLEVWSPIRHQKEVERVRAANQGRHKSGRPTPDPGDLRVSDAPAELDPDTPLRVSDAPAEPADTDGPAGVSGTDIPGPAGVSRTDLRVHLTPATDHDLDTTTTDHCDEDLRTAVTGPRATGRDEPDSAEVLPDRCDHGLPSRRRRDGSPSCALCRRELPATALAPVIPIRSVS